MAGKEEDSLEQASAGEAMNLVLKAEQEAQAAVRACEAQAAERVLAAQQQANRIAARTDARITRLQMRTSQRVAEEIRSLKREEEKDSRQQAESYRIDDSLVSECIDRVAVDLTGGDPANPGKGGAGE